MNRKNKISLLILLVLGILTAWFVINNRRSTIKEALKDFAVEDTASINKIFLADRNNTITLQKVKPGQWTVNDKFKARNDAVSLLLYTIKMLEVKQPVGKKARENVIRKLIAGATKVEIYQNDKLVKVYYVGGETQDHLGTYMLLHDHETGENSSIPFVMYIPGFDGYLTTRYFTDLNDWRGKIVFQHTPPQIKSVKVEFIERPEFSYEISLPDKNRFELKHLQTNTVINDYDTLAVKQYISGYQNVNFETLLTDNLMDKAKKDSILSQPVIFSIELTDINGEKNKVQLYHKAAEEGVLDVNGEPLKYDLDRMYALINNGKDFVVVQYYVFGKLLQPIGYFANSQTDK